MAGSEMKTHKSAVVIIPPEEIWEPIQKIRRLDSQAPVGDVG